MPLRSGRAHADKSLAGRATSGRCPERLVDGMASQQSLRREDLVMQALAGEQPSPGSRAVARSNVIYAALMLHDISQALSTRIFLLQYYSPLNCNPDDADDNIQAPRLVLIAPHSILLVVPIGSLRTVHSPPTCSLAALALRTQVLDDGGVDSEFPWRRCRARRARAGWRCWCRLGDQRAKNLSLLACLVRQLASEKAERRDATIMALFQASVRV